MEMNYERLCSAIGGLVIGAAYVAFLWILSAHGRKSKEYAKTLSDKEYRKYNERYN